MVSVSLSQNQAWTFPTGPGESNRHRPGDTYVIGGKPHDPLDPGPWLWNAGADYRPDWRTGRHRRGELSDPIREDRPKPSRENGRPRPFPEPAYYFGKLREDAWNRFLDCSTDLAEAHFNQEKPSRAKRWFKRLLRLLHV